MRNAVTLLIAVALKLPLLSIDIFVGSTMAALASELFRNVLEGLHTGVYVADRSGKILFWNGGAERITGYLRQDMMGRICQNNFLGQTDGEGNELDGTLSPMATALRDGKPVDRQVS